MSLKISSSIRDKQESSAKREKNMASDIEGKSLMKIKNNRGPKTLPWGTPVETNDFVESL